MTDEPGAWWLADVGGALCDCGRQLVESVRRHDQGTTGEHIDPGPEPDRHRRRLETIERSDDIIHFGISEEPQRDVPRVGIEESHSALVLASERP